jgi:hypothetical protein
MRAVDDQCNVNKTAEPLELASLACYVGMNLMGIYNAFQLPLPVSDPVLRRCQVVYVLLLSLPYPPYSDNPMQQREV